MSSTTRTRTSGPAGGAGKRPRHVPQRTCIGCRETGAQSSFVRVVRRPDGAVEVDQGDRRAAGRGAYLHGDPACWERALGRSQGPLARALRTRIEPKNREALLAFAVQLSQEARSDTTDHGAHGSDAHAAPPDAEPPAAQPETEAGREEPRT